MYVYGMNGDTGGGGVNAGVEFAHFVSNCLMH